MKTVLVVDDYDAAFLFSLAVALKKFDIWLIPADSVEQAQMLHKHMGHTLDLLVTNCGVPRACQFAVAMAACVPGLKIIGIVGEDHDCDSCRKLFAAVLRDERPRREAMLQEWMRAIRSVVQQDVSPGARRGAGNKT